MPSTQQQNPLIEISHPVLARHGVNLSVWRDNGPFPQISGNKWRKLKYNIESLRNKGVSCVASFGGPFSNHLHALAFAGKTFGFRTVGFIRGEIITPYNPTLKDATAWGMQLVPVSRTDYRKKNDSDFIKGLAAPFEPCLILPEGGANQLSLKGCAELAVEICVKAKAIDCLCAPCGTGATLAGLVAGSTGPQVLGFSALKNNTDLKGNIESMLSEYGASACNQWDIIHDYHFGGFAKMTVPLVSFMDEWLARTGIELDPVYTAKMFFGIFEKIKDGYFKPGSHIVAVHTGGLQGLRGMQSKMERLRAESL